MKTIHLFIFLMILNSKAHVFYTVSGEDMLVNWVRTAEEHLRIYLYPHPRNQEDFKRIRNRHTHFMVEQHSPNYLLWIFDHKESFAKDDSRKNLVVADHSIANAFIINHNWVTRSELYPNCTFFYKKHMYPVINQVVDEHPYYNKSDGRDHFFFAVYDNGAFASKVRSPSYI